MSGTSELTTLQRALGELRSAVDSVHARYGEIPAVQRLLGDVDRTVLDATELETATPVETEVPHTMEIIDDKPVDPSLWADADDEGLGGYHR
ncbi:MAG: hypothetical protein ABI232_06745 [Jatrophihabitantaceae bacterium]